ncbi:hypothetical protein Golob_003659 [Gossypium lobatum]|uniref:ENT domain-containing protein n=1 Tax=Gossypium lobatum TaxID=34289 RepID=A0A7J8MZ12_9ROSI|nr:hypothetical protein [Gossypium lobatum]
MLGYLDVSGHKKRLTEKGIVGGKRKIVRLPSPTSKKVDAFVSPNTVLGERCTPSSFNRTDDIVSYASSVGSFSGLGNNGLNLSPSYVTKGYENLEDYCSDADSYCERRCRKEGSFGYTSGGSGTNFHRSELHVYQQALEALYMSGPLTWEEEAKVTNLCCALNISNDEHLRELRKLRHNDNRLSLFCH